MRSLLCLLVLLSLVAGCASNGSAAPETESEGETQPTAASDDDNVAKLLAELDAVPEGRRGAAFHCAAVFVADAADAAPLVEEGIW
ncbi:MAG: hypothetical protein R3344_15535, partial [Acidobacteriota bacterium]|nr:hypothetical protein [Acidobacteriota bacterium]